MPNMDAPRPNFKQLRDDLHAYRDTYADDDSVQIGQFITDTAKRIVETIPDVDFMTLVTRLRAASEKSEQEFSHVDPRTKKRLAWAELDNFIDELESKTNE